MPMPDPKYQRINSAYSLYRANVIDEFGKYQERNDVIILVQNGTAGVVEVDSSKGKISRWQPAYAPWGFPSVEKVVAPNTNLPDAFRDGINTVFPDYDVNDGRCWVTNGDQILSYQFKDNKLDKKPAAIGDMFSDVPQGFARGWDAALTCHQKKVWLFKGDQYTALEQDGTSVSFSAVRSISDDWTLNGKSVPLIKSGIDAAVRVPGGTTGYLFRGDKYVTVDTESGKVTGDEKLIRTYWHGVPYLYPVPDAILRVQKDDKIYWRVFYNQYCVDVSYDQFGMSFFGEGSPDIKLISDVLPSLKNTDYAKGVHRGVMPFYGNPGESAYFLRDGKYVTVKEGETDALEERPIGGDLKAQDLVPYYSYSDPYYFSIPSYRKDKKDLRIWVPGEGAEDHANWLDTVQAKLKGDFLDNLQLTCRVVCSFVDAGIIMHSTEPRVALVYALPPDAHIAPELLYGPNVFNYEIQWPT